jgi:hypothetical protein
MNNKEMNLIETNIKLIYIFGMYKDIMRLSLVVYGFCTLIVIIN